MGNLFTLNPVPIAKNDNKPPPLARFIKKLKGLTILRVFAALRPGVKLCKPPAPVNGLFEVFFGPNSLAFCAPQNHRVSGSRPPCWRGSSLMDRLGFPSTFFDSAAASARQSAATADLNVGLEKSESLPDRDLGSSNPLMTAEHAKSAVGLTCVSRETAQVHIYKSRYVDFTFCKLAAITLASNP